LVSYFPTRIHFPYPVVAHATMELTSNRQNLIVSEANRFLVQQLAETLTEVAENGAIDNDPWHRLRLIAAQGSQDPVMNELGFEAALIAEAKKKHSVPNREGLHGLPSARKRLLADSRGWLPFYNFEDITLWTDDYQLKQILKKIGVVPLPPQELFNRIEENSAKKTLEERVAILYGLMQHSKLLDGTQPPRLIVDDHGELIDSQDTAYFPPTSPGRPLEIPPWMPLRFISSDLVEGLLKERIEMTTEN
jgi:hypothetical protein